MNKRLIFAAATLSIATLAAGQSFIPGLDRARHEADLRDRARFEAQQQRTQEQMAEQAERRKVESEAAEAAKARRYDAEYQRRFDSIGSPEEAKAFLSVYEGVYDPDDLAKSAMKRGYDAGISQAQSCIERANAELARQREIGRTVGLVNRSAQYQAGSALVNCRSRLQKYRAESAAFTAKPGEKK